MRVAEAHATSTDLCLASSVYSEQSQWQQNWSTLSLHVQARLIKRARRMLVGVVRRRIHVLQECMAHWQEVATWGKSLHGEDATSTFGS